MSMRKPIKRASDFETVVTGDINQDYTEVWSAASIELDAKNTYENVFVASSMEEYLKNLFSYKCNVKDYFLNAKFDGSFIIDYLLTHGFKVATIPMTKAERKEAGFVVTEDEEDIQYVMARTSKEMENDTFTTLISAKGIWYSVKIKHNDKIYEIVDALKLLPFSLRKIGKDFKTEHQKLEMIYEDTEDNKRYAGCKISDEEMKYIKNDVLVLKEALNIMFNEGHEKLTIGACCLSEFKSKYGRLKFDDLFPKLYTPDRGLAKLQFGADTVGEYIRKSYKGGWCYLKPEKANFEYTPSIDFNGKKIAGTTCDVNSLYPSCMLSDSGNRYPIGLPTFFKGDIPEDVENDDTKYYFVRVRTRFYLKEKRLPCIQIKPDNDHWLPYPPRTWLETSDYVDKDGVHWRSYYDDLHNKNCEMIPELTFTKTDWELVKYCYDLEDTEILDGCWFHTRLGIFDEYINKYAEIKMKAKGALRQIAKLFLNNLYGKFATSIDSSYKFPYMKDDVLHFRDVKCIDLKRGAYIPIGSAITSYARNFTIRAAIANYDSFIYADTDSIHCHCSPDDIKGCPEDPVKFNHWKYEACWDKAIFVRAKTYIEHVSHENRDEIEKPYYNVRCAGMPDRAKSNFISKLENKPLENENPKDYAEMVNIKDLTQKELDFHRLPKMTLKDFKVGLTVPGSLKPKRIKGGIILFNGDYVMRPSMWD